MRISEDGTQKVIVLIAERNNIKKTISTENGW